MSPFDQNNIHAMALMANGYNFYQYRNIRPLCTQLIQAHGTGILTADETRRREVYFYQDKAIKIWSKKFYRQNYVMAALLSGFYHTTSIAFSGLIYDNEAICRGYVMHQGKRHIPHNLYTKMLHTLIRTTQTTGFCFTDFIRENLVVFRGKPCIIDLENVVPVSSKIKTTKNPKYDLTIRKMLSKMNT